MRYQINQSNKSVAQRPVTQSSSAGQPSKIKKWWIIVVVLGILIIWLSITARPGDFLFTPKLIMSKVNNPQSVLADRVNAYKSLAEQGSCAQVILAENEIFSTLQRIQPTNTDEKQQQYSQVAATTEPLNTLKSNCKLNPAVLAISDVYWLLASQSGGDITIKKADFTKKLSDYSERYDQAQKAIAGSQLSQSIITKTNSSLLEINRSIFSYSSRTDDINNLNTALDFLTINKNLIYINELLNSADTNYFPWQGDVLLVCTVFKDKSGCDPVRLNASLNSIRVTQQPWQISTSGKKLFTTYFQPLIAI